MPWSHRLRLPPLRQGELDRLCGLYAVVNGPRLLLGLLPTRMPARPLFGEVVRLARAEVDLEAVLTRGIEARELWRVVKATVRSISDNRGVGIVADRPFASRSRPNVDDLRREIAADIRDTRAVYLVSLRGDSDHWTVVRRVTAKAL